jgi:HlyD family secretion protein
MRRTIAAMVLCLPVLLILAGCGRPGPYVRASGVVEMDEVDVASTESGRVARLMTDEGDTVSAGETLAVLHRGELNAQVVAQIAQAQGAAAQAREVKAGPRTEDVRAARADLASAEAQLELAEKQLARMQTLGQSNAVAPADVDKARADRDGALARRDGTRERLRLLEAGSRSEDIISSGSAAAAARAQVAALQSRLGELYLIAPSNGVVLLRNFDPGELVQPGQPVVTLGNPDRMWVRVYVAAPEIGRVRIGARVDVFAEGYGKRTFPGHVATVATRAEFTPRAALTEEERANIVFAVKVAMDPTGGALKPGLPVEVRIAAPPDAAR